jgi:hypothetical protein
MSIEQNPPFGRHLAMRKLWSSTAAVVCGLMTGVGAARGSDARSDGPLLVVVEARPELGIDATDIRRSIATELGRPVVSPGDATAGDAASVLIVALDGRAIRISLRERSTTHVARLIANSAEPSARLRSITWLAGNLARDQTSAILALRSPAERAPGRALVLAQAADVKVPVAPPPERAATEPPAAPAPPPWPPAAPMASVTATSDTTSDAPDTRWMVTAAGGMTAARACSVFCPPETTYENNYALELQHRSTPRGLIVGAALDAGPTSHLLGVVGFVGSRWQRRGWFAEATLGAGVLAARVQVQTATVTSSSVSSPSIESASSTQVQPALYGRAVGTIGLPISGDLDLVARLGIHLASTGMVTDFLSATAGVRIKLP